MTIDTTPAHAARVTEAYGDYLGLGRDATAGEVKAAVIAQIKQIVFDYERRAAVAAAEAALDRVDPT